MAKIINLRQVRKQRARDDRRVSAKANSVRFGEATATQKARKAESERAGRMLEAHRRDDGQNGIGLTDDD